MKFALNLFIIFFIAAGAVASDRISLVDVPWTDAAHFWFHGRSRLPEKDRNLMGNQIRIGGKAYARGIAGRTEFSVVYNLSGEALSFRAILGIDDQDHPKDDPKLKASPVTVVILVDRKEVFRREIRLGEPGVPLELDLRGTQQLELRGESDTFRARKQRIVFADPELVVKSGARFMKQAKEWRVKARAEFDFSPNYPPPPAWKNLNITKVKYGIFEHAYKVDNGVLEMVFVPEYGGRLMSLRLHGLDNILCPGPKKIDRSRLEQRRYTLDGGHFSRPEPKNYFYSLDPILMFRKYRIEFPEEGKIVMTSAASWYLFLRYKYIFTVEPGKNSIKLQTVHENIAPFARKAGVWSITQIRADIARKLRIPAQPENCPRQARIDPAAARIIHSPQWDIYEVGENGFNRKGAFQWEQFAAREELQAVLSSWIFTKKYDISRVVWKDMGDFYPAHFYINRKFLEVECNGPIKMLAPSESVSLDEQWIITSTRK